MEKQNFNKEWYITETGAKQMACGLGRVTLPHDAMIFTRRSRSNPAGGACGWYANGNYEYSKSFRLKEEEKGKTVILEFEGIYNRGYVYVNGTFAGSVHYGYTRLILDITPYIRYEEENEVRVKVINGDGPNSRWYTGSGLYRPVNLYVGGEVRIALDGLRISTLQVNESVSTVHTEIQLEYDGKTQKNIQIETFIKDGNGTCVAKEKRPVTLLHSGKLKITQNIFVKNARLWSPEHPDLYTCEVNVREDEEILDKANSTFGIRSVTIDPVHGMRINGETIKLRGGCIHHDNGIVGAATFERAEERRAERMKEAGFNAIRITHNTASKSMLDACDRLGMLVMDESYDVWNASKSTYDYSLDFADHWEKDLTDFVAKDYNHPCVIMYSIGNEILEVGTADGEFWNRRLAQKVRELDSTRLVTNAINGLMIFMRESQKQENVNAGTDIPEQGVNDVMTESLGKMNEIATDPMITEKLEAFCADLDLSGYNYMRGVYDIYKEKYPNRVYYGSETCPPDIDLNWTKVKEIPACIGDFTWTAWDYIGEAGVGIVDYNKPLSFMEDYPVYLAYCSDIDLIGNRRPMSYYREIVFGLRKDPYLAVQLPEHYEDKTEYTPWVVPDSVSSWNWGEYEGKPCKVEVYSDAEEVELRINGKSCGKQAAGEQNRFKAIFDVIYEAGTVEAVSYRNGVAAETYQLETADQDVTLHLQPDRAAIDRDEIAYIMISLNDAEGRLNTDTDRKVKVKVSGAGTLQALGSANPTASENFFDEEWMTYYGKVLAVVRAGEEAGTITITAEAEGCRPVSCEIKVK